MRHNAVVDEWHHWCAAALQPSVVTDEPLIHNCRQTNKDAGASSNQPIEDELRGDIAVHGFWHKQKTAIFDVRITDTDCRSNRHTEPHKILARQEKEKKQKYLDPCLERRRTFTPLVFSVDGLRGKECAAASRRLALLLSKKWSKTYSQVCGFVRSRLAISLVRAASMCLRGTRDPTAKATHPIWETGHGLGLYSH